MLTTLKYTVDELQRKLDKIKDTTFSKVLKAINSTLEQYSQELEILKNTGERRDRLIVNNQQDLQRKETRIVGINSEFIVS